MGTAGRSTPLRRTGSLLVLLGLELAAVLGLHWLGRFRGLRVRWDAPVPWLLSSPVQEVLGALLRSVALVMAYWLLASTLLYLLASLTRLPSAVRAVGWATLPLARRVADHALAVTLATSMVGTTTLAAPALAAEDRGRFGPPARLPAAAAQATGTGDQTAPPSSGGGATEPSDPAYTPDPADQAPSTEETTPPAPDSVPPTRETTAPTEAPTRTSEPAYTPLPADQAPRRLPASTTTTTRASTTTEPTTTTTAPTTTTSVPTTTEAPTTTGAPATTAAPTTTAPAATTGAPATTAPPDSARQGAAAGATSTTGLREPGYTPTPATPTPTSPSLGGGGTSPPPAEPPPKAEQKTTHEVAGGENLWTIARDHLEGSAAGGSGEPTNDQVTAYWTEVKAANQDRLASGDPDVIEAGETVVLPPVPSTAADAGPAPETRRRTATHAARGDSLWTIARDHLAAVGKGEPSTRQVAEYWEKVKAANQDRVASGDPDLIEPGERIVLPPVD
jgi:hypothetical protein